MFLHIQEMFLQPLNSNKDLLSQERAFFHDILMSFFYLFLSFQQKIF